MIRQTNGYHVIGEGQLRICWPSLFLAQDSGRSCWVLSSLIVVFNIANLNPLGHITSINLTSSCALLLCKGICNTNE